MLFNLSKQELSILRKAIDLLLQKEEYDTTGLRHFKFSLHRDIEFLPISEDALYQRQIPLALMLLSEDHDSPLLHELLDKYLLALQHWRLSECPSR